MRMGAARRNEARPGMRLRERTRHADADLDPGQGFPFVAARKSLEVPEMRIPPGSVGF